MRKVATSQLIVRNLPKIKWDNTLTNSARSTFWNCRKKFEWSYLRRLSPRAPFVPFLVGGLVHDGLDRMYSNKKMNEAEERCIAEEACEKACMEKSLTGWQSDKMWEQQAVVMGILRGYEKLYLKKDLKNWKIIAPESEFAYDFYKGKKGTWQYRGKRDLLVRRKKDNAFGLVEHKTTAMLNAGYIAKLPLDSQILGYASSVLKEFKKLPDFVLYNVMKKTQLRKTQRETFDAYMKRVEKDYLLSPTSYFYRETLSFSKRDIANFDTELLSFAKEMERSIKEGYFYKNTTHCTAMGVCQFMALCIEGPTPLNLSRFKERKKIHDELGGKED